MVVLGMAVGFVIGGLLVYATYHDRHLYQINLATEKMKRAFREVGKLSKKIHKQRLIIKALKANQIPRPKKDNRAAQPTVSH